MANATSLSFDASDLMPASVGAGSFWNEMVNWIADGGENTEDHGDRDLLGPPDRGLPWLFGLLLVRVDVLGHHDRVVGQHGRGVHAPQEGLGHLARALEELVNRNQRLSAMGEIDGAFLNAGLYGFTGPIDEYPLDGYRAVIGTNIDGVVLGVRQCVPVLRTRGGGALVATASVAGIVATAGLPAYVASKHGVWTESTGIANSSESRRTASTSWLAGSDSGISSMPSYPSFAALAAFSSKVPLSRARGP